MIDFLSEGLLLIGSTFSHFLLTFLKYRFSKETIAWISWRSVCRIKIGVGDEVLRSVPEQLK